MMKKIIIIFCFVLSIQNVFAQDLSGQNLNKKLDSLKDVLAKTTKPFDRFNALLNIAETVSFNAGDPDSALCTQLLQIAQEIKNDSLLAISYNLVGQYVSRVKGDNAGGLEYFFKAIPLAKKAHDKRRLSSIYFDMAIVYYYLENDEEFGNYIRKGGENMPDKSHPRYDFLLAQYQRGMATYFLLNHQPDSALFYAQPLITTGQRINSQLLNLPP